MANELLYEKRDFYAVLTYNRPDRLNAIDPALEATVREAVLDFNDDPRMRVGILTGAGRAFSAGMDLKAAAARAGRGEQVSMNNPDSSVPIWNFSGSPKPFIAAINGLAVGGGLERALDCDIRICSTDAYFGFFEPKRGIMAGYAVNHLARMIDHAAASYMLLTGDRIEPEQAREWGIVTEVVEPDRLMPRAIEIAHTIAENAPLSVQGTKAEVQGWRMARIDDQFRVYEWIHRHVLSSEDAKEGPRAFAEKRDPVWQGR